jgi:hypothetical protein
VLAPLSVHLARIYLLLRNAIATVEFVPRELGWWGIRIPKLSLLSLSSQEVESRWQFGLAWIRTNRRSPMNSLYGPGFNIGCGANHGQTGGKPEVIRLLPHCP